MLSSVKSQDGGLPADRKLGGDVISGGVIEVNKWGLHTKFRGSSSTRSRDLEPSSNLQHLQNGGLQPTGSR